MPCGKTRLTTSPNTPAKALSHMDFVWGTYFLGPLNLWVSRVEVFAVLYGAFGTKRIGHRVCVAFVAVWYTLSWIETALQLVWRDSTPIWILDGFKCQASTVSLWWTTGEGGTSTIDDYWHWFFLTTSYYSQMIVPRLNLIGLPWKHGQSITTFTCKYYPLI